jgi:hypothetical protein
MAQGGIVTGQSSLDVRRKKRRGRLDHDEHEVQNAGAGGKFMKYVAVFFMLAAAVATSAQTKEKETQKKSTGATQALVDLENQWVDALTKSDAATLDAIFVESYVDTDEHNQRSDKQGVLALLKSGDLKMTSIKLSDMRVYDYGDAAVVTGSAAQVGSVKGQPVTPKLIFTDTFIRQNGKWKAVASHRSAA